MATKHLKSTITKNGKRIGRPPRTEPYPAITAELVRSFYEYKPETGLFHWRVKHSNVVTPGDETGWMNTKNGYIYLTLYGKAHRAHRIAWLYMTGVWPTYEIDHINGDRADNKFSNLRDVPRAINQLNATRPRRSSTTGLRGVEAPGKLGTTYRVRIKIGDKRITVGRYATPEAAHLAYLEAKKKYTGL